ncbi:diaminopimelate epimerase-like [Haliotis rufescens]|uniref:diaminopimelate epimerase-like n=1 Tax=Haliotis rufescens TaxID=6454 RepID=UPI00201F633A|nr:diaminopimelate epimerase-like [Haliotis rufescens]
MAATQLTFSKYHGLGNDFLLLDNTQGSITISPTQRRLMCDRRYGVGADGLIILGSSKDHAFVLDYFNSDGQVGSLCGNGSRCGLAFALSKGLIGHTRVTFKAYDGVHDGLYLPVDDKYCVSMKDRRFEDIEELDSENYFVDTGSPHHVRFVDSLDKCDVIKEGRQLRYGKYGEMNGANVNFVEVKDGAVCVRTYERGVEDETEACGTGATAVALVTTLRHIRSQGGCQDQLQSSCDIAMGRGILTIKYDICEDVFKNIMLIGKAVHVFDGVYYL